MQMHTVTSTCLTVSIAGGEGVGLWCRLARMLPAQQWLHERAPRVFASGTAGYTPILTGKQNTELAPVTFIAAQYRLDLCSLVTACQF